MVQYLRSLDLKTILDLNEVNFIEKMNPIYEAIKLVSNNDLTKNKSTIGFVGAPWTLLVYMINKNLQN